MKSTWTLNEKSNGVLSVSLDGEAWVKAQGKALKKLAEKTEIKGFRKGKAPVDKVKASLSEQEILISAVETIAQEALEFGLAESKIDPISRPELGVEKLTTKEAVMTFTFDVKPEVTLGQYKDLGIKREKVIVTQKEIDDEIEKLREEFAELVLKETGHVEPKDTAVIDFEGFKDGVAFEGGKGENYALEIGSNSFIPGFEEALIGLELGSTKDVELTFPENYQAEHLAGQKVVFKVKINEIKSKQLPEVNDDFAKTVNHHDTDTLIGLFEHLEMHLKEDKEQKADEAYTNAILTKVVDGATVEVPTSLVNEEAERMMEDFNARLKQQGFSLEQFTQITGQTVDSLKEQMSVDASGKVKVRLVLDSVANAENIEVNPEEIEVEYNKIAESYSMEVAKVKELAQPETIAYDLRLRKAFDLIKAD
ncbi:MAG: trigger [Erysipelotrichaceae bacterium]|nr:MAG: trigger [Erysipelotrichaceae bacterium]